MLSRRALPSGRRAPEYLSANSQSGTLDFASEDAIPKTLIAIALASLLVLGSWLLVSRSRWTGETLAQTSSTPRPSPDAAATTPQPPRPDPLIQTLVSRLDLQRYKATIKGLTQFGDRRQGTARNRKAVDWIEAQLASYGCPTGRIAR